MPALCATAPMVSASGPELSTSARAMAASCVGEVLAGVGTACGLPGGADEAEMGVVGKPRIFEAVTDRSVHADMGGPDQCDFGQPEDSTEPADGAEHGGDSIGVGEI